MTSPPLGELYDLLRAEGFAIGVDDHVRIARLLQKDGAGWTEETLRVAVRALVAKDVRERAVFDGVWRRWLVTAVVPEGLGASPSTSPSPSTGIPRARVIAFVVLGVVVAAVIAVFVLRGDGEKVAAVQPDARVEIPVDAGPAIDAARRIDAGVAPRIDAAVPIEPPEIVADAAAAPEAARDAAAEAVAEAAPDAGPAAAAVAVPPPPSDSAAISMPTALLLGVAGLALLALAIAIAGTVARRRRAFVPGPWTYRRVIPAVHAPALDREDVEDGAAHLTWQPLAEGGAELDVDRTVMRTLDAGGLPAFVYRPPPPAPEYLVLEDLAGGADRWRPLFDELLRGLAREGVRMQRFTFLGSPELCTPAAGGAVTSLRDLAEHGDALIVIGDGAEAIDPDTGKPAAWLDTLRHVPRRLWINPLPPARWSEAARIIGDQTPMEHGVAHALAALHAGVDRRDPPTHAYPRVIDRAPASDAGIEALRLHLGGAAFRALALTAATADATGPSTRWVAQRFAIGLDEGAWLRLVSLPWLADRKWPAGLRERLVHELPDELAPDAERALGEILAASEPRPGSAAHLRWQLDRAGAAADRGEAAPALAALSGLAATPLHAEAARQLQLAGVPDLRRRAAVALAALGLGLTAFAAARWTWRSAPPPVPPSLATELAVTTHAARATGMRRLTIDRVQATPVDDLTRLQFDVSAIDLATMGAVLEIDDPDWTVEIDGREVPTSISRGEPDELAIVFAVQTTLGPRFGDALTEPLAALAERLMPAARVRVVTFGDDVWVAPADASPARTLREITGEEPEITDPALAAAIDRGLKVLAAERPTTGGVLRRVLVIVADGRDPSYGAWQPDRLLADGKIAQLGERADRLGVRIDTIAYSPDDQRAPMKALGELSARSHGVFRWVRKLVDEASARIPLDRLEQELSGAYRFEAMVAGPPMRVAVSARLAGGVVRSAVATVPAPSCRGVVCSAGTTCDGDRCRARRAPSNRVSQVLRPIGLSLCALGVALLLHVAWIRARFAHLGLRLVPGRAPARLPRAYVVALIALAAAIAGGVAGALLWRTIAPPPAAVAAAAAVTAWPAKASPLDLRVDLTSGQPEIVARISNGSTPPPLDTIRLVQADPGEDQIAIAASSVQTYAEGPEPLGLAVVIDADVSAAILRDALAPLAAAGPAGSRAALIASGEVIAPPGPLARLASHDGAVLGAELSPDGTRLVTASEDGFARVFDARNGQLTMTLDVGAPVTAAVFSHDGAQIATAGRDGALAVWDAGDGSQRLSGSAAARPTVLEYSPDDDLLLMASGASPVLYRMANQVPVILPVHTGDVRTAEFSPDGVRVAIGDDAGIVRIVDVRAGTPDGELRAHTGAVRSLAWGPDSHSVVTGGADGVPRIWTGSDGANVELRGHTGGVWHVAWDGGRILTTSDDGTIRIWDAATATSTAVLQGHRGMISDAAFSPDGSMVASVGDDRTLRLWDAATGAAIATLDGHTARIATVAWSRDGARVVTASDDQTARVWAVRPTGDDVDGAVDLAKLPDLARDSRPADLAAGVRAGLGQLARMDTPRKLLVVVGGAGELPAIDPAIEVQRVDQLPGETAQIVAAIGERWYARFPGAAAATKTSLTWDGEVHLLRVHDLDAELRLAPRWTPPWDREPERDWMWLILEVAVGAMLIVVVVFRLRTSGVVAIAVLAFAAGAAASVAVRRAVAPAAVPVADPELDAGAVAELDVDGGARIGHDDSVPDAAVELADPDIVVADPTAALTAALADMRETTAKLVNNARCATALRQLDDLAKRAKAAKLWTKDVTKLRADTLTSCRSALAKQQVGLELTDPSHIKQLTRCFAKAPLDIAVTMLVYIDGAGSAFDVDLEDGWLDTRAAAAVKRQAAVRTCARSAALGWQFAKIGEGFVGVYEMSPDDLGSPTPREIEVDAGVQALPPKATIGIDKLEDRSGRTPSLGERIATRLRSAIEAGGYAVKTGSSQVAYRIGGKLAGLSNEAKGDLVTVSCKISLTIMDGAKTLRASVGPVKASLDIDKFADVGTAEQQCVDAAADKAAEQVLDTIGDLESKK